MKYSAGHFAFKVCLLTQHTNVTITTVTYNIIKHGSLKE